MNINKDVIKNVINVDTSINDNSLINILYSANLFDESTYINGMAWNNATGFPNRATAYFNITAGKTYSISASNISRLNGGGVNVFEKSQPSASTSISSVVSFGTDGSLTFTASSGATILAIQLSIPSGNISSSNYPDIMIVEGSTLKPYAKYVKQPSINVEGEDIYVKGQSNGIIESGSNSNGNYVKFADGTLIQYGKVLINSGSNATTSGGITYYVKNSTTVVFPIRFYGTTNDIYCYTTIWGFNYFYYAYMSAVGNQTADIRYGSTLENSERNVSWLAIGRWK